MNMGGKYPHHGTFHPWAGEGGGGLEPHGILMGAIMGLLKPHVWGLYFCHQIFQNLAKYLSFFNIIDHFVL